MSTLKLSGLNSGSSIIKAPDSGSTGVTFTLPASAGTLVTSADVPITTTATSNIGLGSGAVDSITTGDYNVGLGDSALTDNTTGASNTGVGRYDWYEYLNAKICQNPCPARPHI